jgi:tetratricopeptide (TPR) repeat protein
MVKSPFYVESKALTRSDELRNQIDELEAMIGRLGYGLGKEALKIPVLFDSTSTSLAAFQAEGKSMRAEQARLETVSVRFSRKANVFLREIGGAGVLEDARRMRQADPEDWWWFADQLVANRRRDRIGRLLRLGVGVVVVLLVLFVLYQRFLAPDPATRERLEHEHNAEDLAIEGDIAGALSEVEQALAVAPDDSYLAVFKGVLQQELGQGTASRDTFAEAEAAFGNREDFLLTRAQTYMLVDQPEAAVADAQEAVTLNPELAAGYMLLGRAYEYMEDYREALFAYEQAIDLAEEQGDFQLSGAARVNVGILMQRLQAQPLQDQ